VAEQLLLPRDDLFSTNSFEEYCQLLVFKNCSVELVHSSGLQRHRQANLKEKFLEAVPEVFILVSGETSLFIKVAS
jgi:hypothetical protein